MFVFLSRLSVRYQRQRPSQGQAEVTLQVLADRPLLHAQLHDLVALALALAFVRVLVLAFAQRDLELKRGSINWQLRMAQGNRSTTTGSAAKP